MSKNEWNLFAEDVYGYFKNTPLDTILDNAVKKFRERPENFKSIIQNGLSGLIFLPGGIDEAGEDYSLIRIYLRMLKERIEDFKWLYEHLADYRSKVIFIKVVRYWFTFDLEELIEARETEFRDYFDMDLIPSATDAVLADCGAYIGDSIIDFYYTYGGDYRRIYAYEMVEETFNDLVRNTSELRDIVYRNCGVGKERSSLYIDENTAGSGSRLSDHGSVRVDVVPLDEDIHETISMIKMDIEGAEMDALEGARNHIANEKPILMISAYHKPADIFDIPRWICEQRDDYKLYMRTNGRSVWPADFVVYGV